MNDHSRRKVEFYFDTVSPYVWLASTRLLDLESETGAAVECVPVLFAGLLNAHGQKGPAEIPAKRAYTFMDVMRRAALDGIEFRGPPMHPFNPLKSLRSALAVEDRITRTRYVCALLHAAWSQGEDLTCDDTIRAVANQVALDGDRLLSACQDDRIKAELKRNTERAVGDGVFGVPTFRLDGELFWGADRLNDLRARLLDKAPSIDENRLRSVLQRTASAQR
ncbi:MAG: 2-hydroxychromene-2-carboxylate isomerase [Wenzhouxiangellaceae bacterium]